MIKLPAGGTDFFLLPINCPMRWILGLLALTVATIPLPGAGEAGSNLPSAIFPKDHPGAVYPELKIYDALGNPIRVPREDWAGAAQRAATDPAWAKWVRDQRTDLDDWMAKRRDKVEWVAGWFHDFVSPKDASQLIFTPDEPGPDTLKSRSDPKVKLTPKLHAAWVQFFRQGHANKMLAASRLYRLTREKMYADWAAAWLDFYADNYLRWPLNNPEHNRRDATSRIMGQALDEAVVVSIYVQTARTLGDYVTPVRRQHWIDALFKPEAELLQQTRQSIHNIACWQRSAVGQIALYAQDDVLWKQAVNDPNGIHDQIARGVTSDYLWYEQSLHYNGYVVTALTPLFTYAQMEGRGEELREDMMTIENLMLTPAEMRFPTGQLPNPADGGKAEYAPDAAHWTSVAPLFPTKYGVYQLAHQKSWAALLDPPDPASVPTTKPDLPKVISRSFESSRMAVIRRGPWQVYLHYGQLTGSHVQAEALNFEAFFNDTDVTHDAGTVGYGSPMYKDYYETGVCHNVPLVDGIGQVSWNRGQLDRFTDSSVSASQRLYQPKANASRTLTIDGTSLIDTVHIAATDGRTHALGFLLHAMGKVGQLPAGFVRDLNPEQIQPVPGFKYWRDASRATCHDRVEFNLAFDKITLHVIFELPGDFTIWHASAPDLLPRRRDVFYLETHGQNAALKTTLRPAATEH